MVFLLRELHEIEIAVSDVPGEIALDLLLMRVQSGTG